MVEVEELKETIVLNNNDFADLQMPHTNTTTREVIIELPEFGVRLHCKCQNDWRQLTHNFKLDEHQTKVASFSIRVEKTK